MKKRILIIILLAVAATFANAQSHTYLGKRFMFNADATLSPAWLNQNPMSPHLQGLEAKWLRRYLGLNYWVSPSVEAIVWDKGSVGAGYNFYQSPFSGIHYEERYSEYYGTAYSWSYDFSGLITAHGFNVFYKQYVGETFAPLGRYFKFTFDGLFYNYKTQFVADEDALFNPDAPFHDSGKDMLFGLKVEYGRDFLLWDCLKLSLGMSVGTTFGGYRVAFKKLTLDNYNPTLTYNNYARNRMLGAYWFGVKMAIGFLAF